MQADNSPSTPYAQTKTLIIRNIPESIRRDMKSRAAQEGKSMQGLILEIITRYLREEEK